MKKIIVACMLLVPSIVFAWSNGFAQAVAELRQMVPKDYPSAIVGEGRKLILFTDACADNVFVSTLREKYSTPNKRAHLLSGRYDNLVCFNGVKEIAIW